MVTFIAQGTRLLISSKNSRKENHLGRGVSSGLQVYSLPALSSPVGGDKWPGFVFVANVVFSKMSPFGWRSASGFYSSLKFILC